jgi:hypothetical protein
MHLMIQAFAIEEPADSPSQIIRSKVDPKNSGFFKTQQYA